MAAGAILDLKFSLYLTAATAHVPPKAALSPVRAVDPSARYVAPYAVSARNRNAICYDAQNKIKNTEEKARFLKQCYMN
jgi:hypothetical protein